MNSSFTMKLQAPEKVASIKGLISEARRKAEAFDVNIEFLLNDVLININRFSSVEDVYNKYINELQERVANNPINRFL